MTPEEKEIIKKGLHLAKREIRILYKKAHNDSLREFLTHKLSVAENLQAKLEANSLIL